MQYRTDLALEKCLEEKDLQGVWQKEQKEETVSIHTVEIRSKAAQERLGKPIGKYITLFDENMVSPEYDESSRLRLARILSRFLHPLIPREGPVLLIGLGNRHMTADALGTKTIEKMLVTRHMPFPHPFRSVCAVSPGVLGVTGIETAEMVKGLVSRVQPSCVICIDSLSARESKRICTTIQMTDTGICPGSGVGNHRMALNQNTLGIPVLAIGVPMVVYASVIVRDALSLLLKDVKEEPSSAVLDQLTQKASGKSDMVVTPREVDELVGKMGSILSLGINLALQENLSEEEILFFAHDHL